MRALVVDDSRATRAILKRILTEVGFDEIDEAADGQEALARLEENGAPRLALVDWNMPVMDGLSFVRAVRADDRYADVAIMMVTTEADMDHMVTALEAGANEYAMKPFTPAVIREKLDLIGVG